jgi:sterol desaturase/sphingolipid hydroxylase (fatty acid hydroxylase superfamily)
LPLWVSAPLVATAFLTLVWLEQRRPLRPTVEPRPRHLARNLTVALLSTLAVQVAELPLILPLAAVVEERRWGLLQQLPLPAWAEVPLALVLLDYTLYLWHVLTHRVPFLWRFHAVHHTDLDLDASTALRFHFGEILISIPWRALQVVAIGVSVPSFTTWQTFLLLSILFHHANVHLPATLERRLVRVVATPRMHGIHHSAIREETDSNWSSGLTLWDRLHGTLRLDVPQAEIRIGVPGFQSRDDVALPRLLVLPFRASPPAWPPTAERRARRAPQAVASGELLG